jgi:hypothetical protein
MPNMLHAKKVTDGPSGVGTRIEFTIGFLASTMTMATEWTVWEPGVALESANVSDGAVATVTRTTLTAVDGGTRMERVDLMEPKRLLAHLATPLLQLATERNARLEFKNIKEIMEGEER